jgi:predicted DNA-binding transcriptional regulator AlpA
MSEVRKLQVDKARRPLITVEQFAEVLQVSVRTVWRLRRSGHVPASIKIAGTVRWRTIDIERWVNRGCPSLKRRSRRPA